MVEGVWNDGSVLLPAVKGKQQQVFPWWPVQGSPIDVHVRFFGVEEEENLLLVRDWFGQ